MQVRRCGCGSTDFVGTVVVTFNNVPISYDTDQLNYIPDWEEGFASEDEVIAAVCRSCGAELTEKRR